MQIIRRARLGNDTEDITFYPVPARPGSIAVMDGYDVLTVPLAQRPPGPILNAKIEPPAAVGRLPKLFDILKLDVKSGPRGITYVERSGAFVFNDSSQLDTLFQSTNVGEPLKKIPLQFINDDPPARVEALGYVPPTAPEFADRLVMVGYFFNDDGDLESRLEIINFNGVVEAEIIPQDEVIRFSVIGVSFKSPGSLLVSSSDDSVIRELDFAGNIIASFFDPNAPSEPFGIEGVESTPDGKIAFAAGFDGLLQLFDPAGGKVTRPVSYRAGPGLSLPSGLAWDSTLNQFLILSLSQQQQGFQAISALSPAFDSVGSSFEVDDFTRKITYLPAEKLIAATHSANPRGIIFFTSGVPRGSIDTTQFGTPVVISFIPATNEFVLVFRDPQDASKRRKLFILSRTGALSRIIDLGPAGVTRISAVAFFNPKHASGGQFLVINSDNNMGVVTDSQGVKLSEFSVRDALKLLTPTAVTAITSGADAGAFGIVNGETSEIVTFRLD